MYEEQEKKKKNALNESGDESGDRDVLNTSSSTSFTSSPFSPPADTGTPSPRVSSYIISIPVSLY
jgi:hypothetical protein